MVQAKSARVTCGGLLAGDVPVECGAAGTGTLRIDLSFLFRSSSLETLDVMAVLTSYDTSF